MVEGMVRKVTLLFLGWEKALFYAWIVDKSENDSRAKGSLRRDVVRKMSNVDILPNFILFRVCQF